MFALSEQLTRAGTALLDAQLASAKAVAEAAFESGATVLELNLDAVRTALAESTVAARQLMAARSPQEWFSAASGQSRLALERAGAYGRQAGDIAQGAQARLAGVAQNQMAVSKQRVGELVDVVKQTPAAVATPINSFLKSAFVNVHEAYDKTTHAGYARAEAAPADTVDARQRGAN